jgi:hypothetical protein
MVAVVSASMFLVTNALSSYWTESWARQETVLAQIRKELPELEPGMSLILHGVCPYYGPAIVFESNWDLAGALQAAYGTPSLRADVTSNRLSARPDGLSTVIYNTDTAFYPFGDRLLLFDRRGLKVTRLKDARAFRNYFRRLNAREEPTCPSGSPGTAVQVFWFDDLARGAAM